MARSNGGFSAPREWSTPMSSTYTLNAIWQSIPVPVLIAGAVLCAAVVMLIGLRFGRTRAGLEREMGVDRPRREPRPDPKAEARAERAARLKAERESWEAEHPDGWLEI